jgi:hypothetical protein
MFNMKIMHKGLLSSLSKDCFLFIENICSIVSLKPVPIVHLSYIESFKNLLA